MTTGVDLYWGNGDVDIAPYDFVILQAYDGNSGRKADSHGEWFSRNAQVVVGTGKSLMTYFWLSSQRPVLEQVTAYLDQVRGWPTTFHWIDYEERGLDPSMSDDALGLLPPNSGVYSNGFQYPGRAADSHVWWGAGYPNIVGGSGDLVIHQYADTPHDINRIVDDAWYASITSATPQAPAPTPAPKPKPKPTKEPPDMLVVIQTAAAGVAPLCTVYVANGGAQISPAQAYQLAVEGAPHIDNVPPLEALQIAKGLDPIGFEAAFGKH